MKLLIVSTLLLAGVVFADKPSPTYQAAASSSSDSYSAPVYSPPAPAGDSYGSPKAPAAPAGDSYGSPKAPAAAASTDSYGSPQAPAVAAQDSYGSPQAPAVAAPAANTPGQVGTQGYYYYYYPVQNNGGSGASYGAPAPSYGAPSYSSGSSYNSPGKKEGGIGGYLIGKGIIIALIIGGLIVLALSGASIFAGTGGRSVTSMAKDLIGDVDQDELFAAVQRGLEFVDNLREIYQ